MSQTINCNYARTAVRAFTCKQRKWKNHLSDGAMQTVLHNYNEAFKQSPKLQATPEMACRRFRDIANIFNRKWNPANSRQKYLQTFSTHSWLKLADQEKQQHTLSNCEACSQIYPVLNKAFPAMRKRQKCKPKQKRTRAGAKKKCIKIVVKDNVSPKSFVKQVSQELDDTCTRNFGFQFGTVLEQTPRAPLQKRHNSAQRLQAKRRILQEVRNTVQKELNEKATDMVMTTRTSWGNFDKMRHTLGLEDKMKTLERKRKRDESPPSENTPPQKKVHGYTDTRMQSSVDTHALIEEAEKWLPNETINWSALATKYGLSTPNRGQTVKEFLAQKGIPAAMQSQRHHRQPRRGKAKLPGGRISTPMFKPAKVQKHHVNEKIQSGDITIGVPITESQHTTFQVDKVNKKVVEKSVSIAARLISLKEIREKLLKKHQDMGIIRGYTDDQLLQMTKGELQATLDHMKVQYEQHANLEHLQAQLKTTTRQRFLKIWHDHSAIAGHGHMLVTVAGVYDPGFYFTRQELAQKGLNIDVERAVEQPEIYILGRSTASIDGQSKFNKARADDLECLSAPLQTKQGVLVVDTLRFCHADGPARQFEAGNNIGGHYPCVACAAHSSKFHDIAYCLQSQQITYAERREFVLGGEVWQTSSKKPLDKLTVGELRSELHARGIPTGGRKRHELDDIFTTMRMGINYLPPLLQPYPNRSLTSLNLDCYEIAPTEPLHDIKGHISHLLEETLPIITGTLRAEVQKIIDTVLDKEAKRCSDYRKAMLLIVGAMQQYSTSQKVTTLFSTAAEIQEILYSREDKRTDQSILRLYNLVFIHARLCNDLFPNKSCKLYCSYFHSLTCHAPQLYRLVALRSLNTEYQERMFKQANLITKGTSNMHPNHIIKNILVRVRVSYRIFCWEGDTWQPMQAPPPPIPSARHIIHRVVTN